MSRQRIGILGGTFDPIHNGHLMAAETARERFSLEKVYFMPTGIPSHKHKITEYWHRHLMVVLAVMDNPYFSVSRLEYEREGVSYTVDTMRRLRQVYSEQDTDIYFITGIDTIVEIFGWRESEELLSLCKFIAATRPGYDPHIVRDILGKYYPDVIDFLEMPQMNISSSNIRRRVREGKSIKYLVPEVVEKYIRQQGLYFSNPSETCFDRI
ncbi:MAG TPA: nicotinic acid mononucleotide adenylyltransferase [Peptococcaceae bacterium]|nr:nicotinic acid mononucleotide adenylyltransferase [Peptococcaceae bacterium]